MSRKRGVTLFDTTPRTRPARAPGWVLDALVRLGMSRADATRLPPRAAFARLADMRRAAEKAPKLTPKERRERAYFRALEALNADDAYDADELTDTIAEVVSPLGEGELRRVLAGLAKLLAPAPPPGEPAAMTA